MYSNSLAGMKEMRSADDGLNSGVDFKKIKLRFEVKIVFALK
jgi:hypothetical protein